MYWLLLPPLTPPAAVGGFSKFVVRVVVRAIGPKRKVLLLAIAVP
jgi:hypothetical protein